MVSSFIVGFKSLLERAVVLFIVKFSAVGGSIQHHGTQAVTDAAPARLFEGQSAAMESQKHWQSVAAPASGLELCHHASICDYPCFRPLWKQITLLVAVARSKEEVVMDHRGISRTAKHGTTISLVVSPGIGPGR